MRQDAADNREAIVTAARRLLVEHGARVSMRAIAKEASVGIATVSRHFPDRITLFDAIGADAVHDIETAINQHLPLFETNPEQAWSGAVHAIAELKLALLGQTMFTEIDEMPNIEHIVENRAKEIRDAYAPLITRAKEAGLCPADLEPLEFHIALAIASRPLPNSSIINATAPRIQQELIDIFLDGLEARAT